MSDPMVFDPVNTVETIAGFTKRVTDFCLDPETPVINMHAKVSWSSLVLSCLRLLSITPLPHSLRP